ncbi:MAG: hypothetical protein ACO1SV_12330 [Fimbriimonas sp.]
MGNGWGGRREGSGRKRKADKYSTEIEAAERKIADRLPQIIDNLTRIADGGIEVTHITRERDPKTKKMVIVSSRTEVTLPDRKANEYLADRVMGRPTQEVEMDLTSNGESVGALMFSELSDDELDRRLAEAEGRAAS